MRKLINIAFFIIILFLFCACDDKSIEPSKIKIGISLYRADDTFVSSIKDVIVKEARERELSDDTIISLVIKDATGQQILQNEQIDAFIDQAYDAICVNMTDRTAAAVIIDKAKNANIPVVFFNREPVKEDLDRWEKAFYVGAKAEQSGVIQGNIIAELFKNSPELVDKNNDGIIQYVMIEGELGHQDALIRTEYSIRTLTKADIKVEKLANVPASWRRSLAKENMSKWLLEYGDSIEVVFANNDDMALGAIDACKDYGYTFGQNSNIIVIGVDATNIARESIKRHELFASVYNDEKKQGKAIFELAYSSIKNGIAETSIEGFDGKYLLVDYVAIDRNNIYD